MGLTAVRRSHTSAELYERSFIARAFTDRELEVETNKVVQRPIANAPLSMLVVKRFLLKQTSIYDDIRYTKEDTEVKRVLKSEDAL